MYILLFMEVTFSITNSHNQRIGQYYIMQWH